MNECQQKCNIFHCDYIVSWDLWYWSAHTYTSNHVLQHSLERKKTRFGQTVHVKNSLNGILAFNWFPYQIVHNLLRGHNVHSIVTVLKTHFIPPTRS